MFEIIKKSVHLVLLMLSVMTLASCSANKIKVELIEYGGGSNVYSVDYNVTANKISYWVEHYSDGVMVEKPIDSYESIEGVKKGALQFTYIMVLRELEFTSDRNTIKSEALDYNLNFATQYFIQEPKDIVLNEPIVLGMIVHSSIDSDIPTDSIKAYVKGEGSIDSYLTDDQTVFIVKAMFN